MFDSSWIADLDAASACAAVAGTQEDLREAEWRELALAARWAVLHEGRCEEATSLGGPLLEGTERWVQVGGEGTPEVGELEFACARLAVVMGPGFLSASSLVRDAVDLQHRHPVLWSLLASGGGRVWKARQVARMVHAAGLSREQAWFVDEATTPYLDSLVWSAFTRLMEARLIEARPEGCGGSSGGGGDAAVRGHRAVHRARVEDVGRPSGCRGGDLLRRGVRPDRADPAARGRHRPGRRTAVEGAGGAGEPGSGAGDADPARDP